MRTRRAQTTPQMTPEQRERLEQLVFGLPATQDELIEFAFSMQRTVPWSGHFAYASMLGAKEQGAEFLRKMLRGDPPPPEWL